MSKPDSFLTAARLFAHVAGLPWSKVQPVYRSLQDAGGPADTEWLPKSVGRTIWTAHPNFMSRLIVGLLGSDGAGGAHEAVEIARRMRLDASQENVTTWSEHTFEPPVEWVLSRYITDPQRASALHSVEFALDEGRITLRLKDGRTDNLVDPAYDAGNMQGSHSPRGVCRRGVILGFVFERLAADVVWRLDGSPTRSGYAEGGYAPAEDAPSVAS